MEELLTASRMDDIEPHMVWQLQYGKKVLACLRADPYQGHGPYTLYVNNYSGVVYLYFFNFDGLYECWPSPDGIMETKSKLVYKDEQSKKRWIPGIVSETQRESRTWLQNHRMALDWILPSPLVQLELF